MPHLEPAWVSGCNRLRIYLTTNKLIVKSIEAVWIYGLIDPVSQTWNKPIKKSNITFKTIRFLSKIKRKCLRVFGKEDWQTYCVFIMCVCVCFYRSGVTTYLQGSLVQHPRRNVKCAFNPDSSQGGFAGANTLITVNPQKLTCPNCLQKFTRFFPPFDGDF